MSLPPTVQGQASIAVILGSAFSKKAPQGLELKPVSLSTPWGIVKLYRVINSTNPYPAYIIFRHGLPHQTLPHLVNYRAYTAALKELNCSALLVTSSVGVLDSNTPLHQVMLVNDLLMPDNRLPSGELCTMFDRLQHDLPLSKVLEHALRPGHLVLKSGLFSNNLNEQLAQLLSAHGIPKFQDLTFAYAPGPRTKTKAENHYWRTLGAQVNSMSLGPEIVLANELEIPCSALVVGHKRSLANKNSSLIETQSVPHSSKKLSSESSETQDEIKAMSQSLNRSHAEFESLIISFIHKASPVPFENYIYRFTNVDS